MSDELLITLSSPPVWPFSSPTIPPGITASGRSYTANSGSQVNVVPLDVGGLIALGFTLSASVGVIAKAFNVPIGDQNGIDYPIPVIFPPGAQFMITDVIFVGTGPVAAAGAGALGIMAFANESDSGLGSVVPVWSVAGHASRWQPSSPLRTWSTTTIWITSQSAFGWTPAEDGVLANIFMSGYQTG